MPPLGPTVSSGDYTIILLTLRKAPGAPCPEGWENDFRVQILGAGCVNRQLLPGPWQQENRPTVFQESSSVLGSNKTWIFMYSFSKFKVLVINFIKKKKKKLRTK